MKYFIQSNLNKKFLSNLMEDTHEKTFQAKNPEEGSAYYYNVRQVAEDIAKKENGKVIELP